MRWALATAALSLSLCACGGAPAPTARTSRPAVTRDITVLAAAEAAADLERGTVARLRSIEGRQTAAARVEPLFEAARSHAVRFEHAEALAKIGEAQVLLESEASAPADWAALHRALSYRALFESNLGREDRARSALSAAALLDPDAALSDVEFPPDIIALHQEVATALRAESPAALAVTTSPAGAAVLIDGELAGTAPITLHAAPGQHYVSFAAFGRAHRNLTVDIDADGNTPLDVELPLAGDGELARQLLAIDDAALGALSAEDRTLLRERFAADVLVRVRASGAALALRLSDGAVSAGSVGRGVGTVNTLVAGLPEEPEAEGPEPVEEESESIFASPWLWVAIGVIVVGGAAAAISVAATQEPDPILRASSVD